MLRYFSTFFEKAPAIFDRLKVRSEWKIALASAFRQRKARNPKRIPEPEEGWPVTDASSSRSPPDKAGSSCNS